MPSGCTSKTAIDALEVHAHSTETKVDTANVNISNLAPAYGKVSVAPDLADAVAVTAGSSTWAVGSASGTIFTAADNTIVGVNISKISAVGDYQLNLYAGGTICASITYSVSAADGDNLNLDLRSQKVTGVITAKLASDAGASETAAVKLSYV
jgi:hypothetical protein